MGMVGYKQKGSDMLRKTVAEDIKINELCEVDAFDLCRYGCNNQEVSKGSDMIVMDFDCGGYFNGTNEKCYFNVLQK